MTLILSHRLAAGFQVAVVWVELILTLGVSEQQCKSEPWSIRNVCHSFAQPSPLPKSARPSKQISFFCDFLRRYVDRPTIWWMICSISPVTADYANMQCFCRDSSQRLWFYSWQLLHLYASWRDCRELRFSVMNSRAHENLPADCTGERHAQLRVFNALLNPFILCNK